MPSRGGASWALIAATGTSICRGSGEAVGRGAGAAAVGAPLAGGAGGAAGAVQAPAARISPPSSHRDSQRIVCPSPARQRLAAPARLSLRNVGVGGPRVGAPDHATYPVYGRTGAPSARAELAAPDALVA